MTAFYYQQVCYDVFITNLIKGSFVHNICLHTVNDLITALSPIIAPPPFEKK